MRQGLNKVGARLLGSGPRGAEATLGATASPLGQYPTAGDIPEKARQPPKKAHKKDKSN
jgi:hypothetical protein